MPNEKSWRTKLIWLVIGMVITLVGNAIFSFWIVPYVTDKPEIELLTVETKLLHQGEFIDLNVTLENTGERTASDLLIYIVDKTRTDEHQSEITKNNPSILQAGETFNAIFPLKTPENNESQWILQLWVTTTDGYSWTFDIVYELLDTQQYHLLS